MFNQQVAEEANAYLKDKGIFDKKELEQYRGEVEQIQRKLKNQETSGFLADDFGKSSSKKMVQYQIEELRKRENYEQEMLSRISEARSKQLQADEAIQAKYTNKFMDSNKKLTESNKQSMQGFMNTLDWSIFEGQGAKADSFFSGINKLAEKTTYTFKDMDDEMREATKNAFKSFQNTGALNEYGKSLEALGKKYNTFDMTSWSGYLDEVNKRYESGAMTVDQYDHSLGFMANTLSKLTGIDASTWLDSLKGSSDLATAFENANSGLSNFLKAYDSSINKLNSGNSLAVKLKEQFEGISGFGEDLRYQIDTTGTVTVDWLVEEQKGRDLPTQMNTLIEGIKDDGEVTEVEQKVMVAVQTEIQDEGKLSQDTIDKLQGLYDGSLEITGSIEIAGMTLTAEEARGLASALQEARKNGQELDFSDTGLEKLQQDAKEAEKALSSIKNVDLRSAFEKAKINDNAKEVNALKQALQDIPEDKQVDFVMECGSAFDNVNSLAEGIANIPDMKKLEYNIGVNGNPELEKARALMEQMPEGVRNAVYQSEVIGLDKLQLVKQLVGEVGETQATAIIDADTSGVINNCDTVQEYLQALSEAGIINITTEGDTSGVEQVKGAVDELTEGDNTVEISTEGDTSGAEETEESIEQARESGSEPITITVKTKKEDNGAEETIKKTKEANGTTSEITVKSKGKDEGAQKEIDKVKNANGKTSETTVKSKGKDEGAQKEIDKVNKAKGNTAEQTVNTKSKGTEEAEKSKKTVDDAKGNTANQTMNTTFNLIGKEQFEVGVQKKKEAEKDGEGTTTFNLIGKEQFEEAISKKKEAEKPSQSTTEIIVNGMEQLSQINDTLKTMAKKQDVSIDIKFNMAEAIDTVMSRLGIGNERTETVKVKINVEGAEKVKDALDKVKNAKSADVKVNITAKDDASKTLDKIKNAKSSDIKVNITANDKATNIINKIKTTKSDVKVNITAKDNATPIIQKITSMAKNKTVSFMIKAKDSASGVLSKVTSKLASVKNKTISIIAKDSASAKANNIKAKINAIKNKNVTITAKDNASSKANAIKSRINSLKDKSVTIKAKDNASSVLNSIRNKISGISGKTVTITARYAVSGSKPTGLTGSLHNQEPQVQTASNIENAVVQTMDASARVLSNSATALNNSTASTLAGTLASNVRANQVMSGIDFNVDLLTNITNAIKKLSSEIEILGQKEEYAFGNRRLSLLNQETSLIRKQQDLLSQQKSDMEVIVNELKYYLNSNGFSFANDGTIDNYNDKIIALEKNVKNLQDTYDKYESKNDNDKYKDVLKQRYDDANNELQKVKSSAQQYNNLVFSELPSVTKEYENLENQLYKIRNEIYKCSQEQANLFAESNLTQLTSQYKRLSNEINILNSKISLSNDIEKINLYNQQLSLLEQQKRKQEEINANNDQQSNFYRQYLSGNGFRFDNLGNITNGAYMLQSYANSNSAELESLKDAYNNYISLQEKVSDGNAEWWSLQKEIQSTKDNIDDLRKAQSDAFKSMEKMIRDASVSELVNQYDSLSNALDILKTKEDKVFGENKIQYMKEQLSLLEKQKNKEQELMRVYTQQASQLKNQLANYGARFDEMGQITNYSQIMSWQSSVESMEELKKIVEEYINIQNKELPNSNKSWEDLDNKIQDVKDSILQTNIAMKDMKDKAWTQQFESEIDKIKNMIDINEAKSDLVGANQNELLAERLRLYKKLQIANEEMLSYSQTKLDDTKGVLIEYGFVIKDDGSVDNTVDKLEELKNTLSDEEFNYVNDNLSEYFSILNDEIPGLEKEILKLQKEYEDVQREKLEITQKIEKEITKIYEKQIDDRIKKIKEESEEQVKALEDARDKYKSWREETDYQDDYNKQLEKVQELESKIETAKRDTSLSGQKRLADLMEELKTEQSNLEKLVQDKIDKDVENMFTDSIDSVKDTADEEIKSIEDLWNDSKIAEMIQKSLSTGLFTDIDGNIQELDSALMEFANNSSDYLGIMGNSLKVELLDNLSIALETMNQIAEINKDLQIPDYSKYSEMLGTPPIDMGTSRASTVNNNTITFGNTILTVEGNADSSTIDNIQELLDNQRENIIDDILKNMN